MLQVPLGRGREEKRGPTERVTGTPTIPGESLGPPAAPRVGRKLLGQFISQLVVWTCLAAALHAGLCLLRGGILSHHPILGLCSQCHLLSLFCRLRVSWALLGRSAPLCTLGSSLQGSFTVEGRAVGGSPGNTSPGDGSHTDCHGRGALEPQHVPFFWS